MTPLLWALVVVATPIALGSLVTWCLHPLSVLFELRQKTRPALPLNARVSVVVPAYNEGVVLRACVESILASGYRWLEVVLVDDGSTDDTLAIMREFEHDPRVVVVAKPNGGKGSALNAGIAHATGEVFVFVDADGVFTNTTIPRLRGLWKQRVRWQRGLIQTARLHRRRVWRTPRRPIGAYLPWNLFSMLVVPVLQLVALPLAVAAMAVGALPVGGPVEVALWLGLGLALGVTLLSIALDRSWRDLRLLWALPLWVPLSVMMSAVTLTALWHEARGTQAAWNKLERTGVQTVPLPT